MADKNGDKSEKPEKQTKFPGNFLYMFEVVVDDLLITRQNLCAPEEYPTCTELTFRSSMYMCICDRGRHLRESLLAQVRQVLPVHPGVPHHGQGQAAGPRLQKEDGELQVPHRIVGAGGEADFRPCAGVLRRGESQLGRRHGESREPNSKVQGRQQQGSHGQLLLLQQDQ